MIHVDLGALVELEEHLVFVEEHHAIGCRGEAPLVETRSSNVANVIDERSIDSQHLWRRNRTRRSRKLSAPRISFPTDSGRVPYDTNNVGPRLGFAYTMGERKPFIFRGGCDMFYTRIPSIYTSETQLQNSLNSQHLYLSNNNFYDRQIFPQYLVSCAAGAFSCKAPANIAGALTTEISAFAHDSRRPSSNFTNRDNKRVDITDDGFIKATGQFVPCSTKVSEKQYPAYFLGSSSFLKPNSAYAPRQVQVGIRFAF